MRPPLHHLMHRYGHLVPNGLRGLCGVLVIFFFCGCAGPPPKLRHVVYDFAAGAKQNDHPESNMGNDVAKIVKAEGYPGIGVFGTTHYPHQQRKAINPDSNIYLIVQVDGGGIRGMTPAVLLARLEAALNCRRDCRDMKLRDAVSICSGSSTGAIIAGSIAAGVPAEEISTFYRETGYELFQGEGRLPRPKMFEFKLDREKFQDVLYTIYGNTPPYRDRHVTLGEMANGPLLIVTAFDLVTQRTMFLRTRDECGGPSCEFGNLQLVDAISASAFSGAYVFGKLAAPSVETTHIQPDGQVLVAKGAVFSDGAQGTQISTLGMVTCEALEIILADPKAQVIVMSFGAGNTFVDEYNKTPREKRVAARGGKPRPPRFRKTRFERFARDRRGIEEILATGISIMNQARDESIPLQLMAAQKLEDTFKDSAGYSRMLVYRFDFELTDECGFGYENEVTQFHITEEGRNILLDKADEISEWESFQQLMEVLADQSYQLRVYRP